MDYLLQFIGIGISIGVIIYIKNLRNDLRTEFRETRNDIRGMKRCNHNEESSSTDSSDEESSSGNEKLSSSSSEDKKKELSEDELIEPDENYVPPPPKESVPPPKESNPPPTESVPPPQVVKPSISDHYQIPLKMESIEDEDKVEDIAEEEVVKLSKQEQIDTLNSLKMYEGEPFDVAEKYSRSAGFNLIIARINDEIQSSNIPKKYKENNVFVSVMKQGETIILEEFLQIGEFEN